MNGTINSIWKEMPPVLVALITIGLLTACSSTGQSGQNDKDSVESRGLDKMHRPMKSGMLTQPGSPTKTNVQMPTWPQKFEVQGPEVDSFGFAVTQAGPITIEVQAQGAPLVIALQSAGRPPITQPALGNTRMSYNVTPQDVQRNIFWTVQIRLGQPRPPQQGGRAVGTVNVQHPPVNQAQIQAALATQQQTVQRQMTQHHAQVQQAEAQESAQIERVFQQRKAQFEQQETSRRAALFAQIEPQLDQLRSRAEAIRPRGLEGETPGDAAPEVQATDEIGTRGMKSAADRSKFQMIQQTTPQMSSSQQALGAAVAAPPPQQVMPNPVISSLSVTQGRPGDPLFINGTNFGAVGGEVRFVMGPGKDLPAPAGVVWTHNQIFATIPDEPVLLGFSGTIYIKRAGETITSNLVPFRFEPILVIRDYKMPAMLSDYRYEFPVQFPDSTKHSAFLINGNVFSGLTGTNEYFPNTTLKNGWVLDEVYYSKGSLSCLGGCSYLLEKRIGSNQPYFSIRYWVNAADFGSSKFTSYLIDRISLRGPKGVPDGLACTQTPCSE